MPSLLSVIESPSHPNCADFYRHFGYRETRVDSMRKAISQIKTAPPDVIVCEFFYGYSNNYAGVNISNLDVMLYSLQKYASACKVIVFVAKDELRYVTRLNEIFPLHAILPYPLSERAFSAALS